MKIRYMHLALTLTAIVFFSTGCVITGQMAERKADKAYLRQDYTTALGNYTVAAREGIANAQYHLAVMYAEGQGGEKDLTKAAELLYQAAIQGQTDAQLMLGLFSIYGDGVPQDPATGAEWISLSARNGNDVGMYYLANLYAAGLGVEKDLATAVYWMEQAREAGFPVKKELLTAQGLEILYTD